MASVLGFYIFGIAICLSAIIFSFFSIRRSTKYSFLRYYPYELFDIRKSDNRIAWFFFCLGLLMIAMTGVFLSFNSSGLSFPIGQVAIIFPFVLFTFLTYLTLYHEKWHLAIFLLFSLSSLFMLGSYGYYLFSDPLAAQRSFSKVAGILLLVIALIELCFLANPLLYRYASMKKEIIDGEERLVRPKVVWLAFTEWLYLFIDIASLIIIFLAIG